MEDRGWSAKLIGHMFVCLLCFVVVLFLHLFCFLFVGCAFRVWLVVFLPGGCWG